MQARLAAALERAWVYGGDAPRGVPFANQAVSLADRTGPVMSTTGSVASARAGNRVGAAAAGAGHGA